MPIKSLIKLATQSTRYDNFMTGTVFSSIDLELIIHLITHHATLISPAITVLFIAAVSHSTSKVLISLNGISVDFIRSYVLGN